MSVVEQQSDRDFERQVAYNNYVTLSKTASKLLIFLLSFAAYLIFATVERYQRIEQQDETRTQELQKEILKLSDEIVSLEYAVSSTLPETEDLVGPSPLDGPISVADSVLSERYRSALLRLDTLVGSQALDESTESRGTPKVTFSLPVVNIDVSEVTFFILGPVAFFVLSFWYWIFLSKSRQAFAYIVQQRSAEIQSTSLLHPWLYNMLSKWPTISMLWQGCLELFPVLLFAALLAAIMVSGSYTVSGIVLLSVLSVLPLLCHSMVFSIFDENPTSPALTWLYGFLVINAIVLVIRKPYLFDYSSGSALTILALCFFGFTVLMFIELLSLGKLVVANVLMFPLIVAIMVVLAIGHAVRERSLRDGRAHLYRSWRGLFRPSIGGYYAYFRRRYHALKELERGSEPPRNSLLPRKR